MILVFSTSIPEVSTNMEQTGTKNKHGTQEHERATSAHTYSTYILKQTNIIELHNKIWLTPCWSWEGDSAGQCATMQEDWHCNLQTHTLTHVAASTHSLRTTRTASVLTHAAIIIPQKRYQILDGLWYNSLDQQKHLTYQTRMDEKKHIIEYYKSLQCFTIFGSSAHWGVCRVWAYETKVVTDLRCSHTTIPHPQVKHLDYI